MLPRSPIRVSQRVILAPILGSEWDISDNFRQHLVENLVQRTSTRTRPNSNSSSNSTSNLNGNLSSDQNWNWNRRLNPNSISDKPSNTKPSRASVALLLRFYKKSTITEARSEGLIELKLVRKPPKVSRGYGGVARAGAAASVPGSPRSGLPHRI